MTDEIEVKRLIWHSRRGMLELDVLLKPFVEEAYRNLNTEDQQRYKALLDCEDADLFTWFMERIEPEDQDMAHIVRVVLEHARTRKL